MSAVTSYLRATRREQMIGLTIAAIIGLAVLVPSSAHASGCTDEWKNKEKGGSWFEAGNWSKGVPTSADEVCITENGTYTVTMTQTTGTVSVKSLTVGGTSGTQTLVVGSSSGVHAVLTTAAGITNGAHGAITMTNGDLAGNNVALVGPITNAGTITTEVAHGGARALEGNITNTGTLAINATTKYDETSALLTNEGAINIAAGKELAVTNKGSVTNGTGGKIAATGAGNLYVGPGCTFTEGAGTTSGTKPIIVDRGALAYTGAGSSSIVTIGASTLSGNISAGQSLSIQSTGSQHAFLTAAASFSSAGSITLTNGDVATNNATLIISSPNTLSNSGTITTEVANGGARALEGNIKNTGTLAINATTKYDETSALLSNEGAINIAEGKELAVTNKGSVTNGTGGKIVATGTGSGSLYIGPECTFTEGAGTTSGTKPVTVDRGTLAYTGSGSSSIVTIGVSKLSGNLSAGQTLSIQSTSSQNAETKAAVGFTNAGSIILTNGDGAANFAALEILSGTLSNSGTITSEPGVGGARFLEGNLTNTGTLAINATTKYDVMGTLTNNGAVNVAAGKELAVTAKSTVNNETGGAIAGGASGALVQTEGTFNQGGGTTTGSQPVILDRVALHYTGAGASTIALRGTSTLSGTINAGQVLSIQSTSAEHAFAAAAASFTNSGTIDLTNGDAAANNATLSIAAEGTLTNKGALNSESPHGGLRTIEGSVTNSGTVSLSAGETLKLTDDFTQTGTGMLATAIASASSFGAMSVFGPAKLAGALGVSEVEPFLGKAGESFAILASSKVTGTFSDLDNVTTASAGRYYLPSYSPTGVSVTVTQATLVPSPKEGPAGSTVTLKGTGYQPGDKIKLTFQDAKKAKTTFTTVTASPAGEFSAEVKLSTKAAKGAGAFSATSTNVTGLLVTAPFTVT